MKAILNRLNLRFDRYEISGSLGDMGAFLPLAAGLSAGCGLNFGNILFFAGVMNLISGLMFGLPMPVQPMKVIASVAIAERLGPASVAAAGVLAGAIMLILGATGLIERLGKIIPGAVIRGLQITIGIKLLLMGLETATAAGYGIAPDSVFTAAICLLIAIVSIYHREIPSALIIFSIGIMLVLIANPGIMSSLKPGWDIPRFLALTGKDFAVGFVKGALPQIPLTILNSVVAVCALSGDLFPGRILSAKKVTYSIGLMNLVACPLGGMPMCHGVGGLAAQYGFGARTGGSVVFLGLAKIVLGVAFGGSLMAVVGLYPGSVLGTLLLLAGWQMIVVCNDIKTGHEAVSFIIATIACLFLGIAAGFAVGFSIILIIGKIFPRFEVPRGPEKSDFIPAERERCLTATR